MTHEIEIISNEVQMAYAGNVPWHGLGTKVDENMSPTEIQKAAGLDWTVRKEPLFMNINGENVKTERQALVRDSDNSILSYVSDTWNPVQNNEAFDFFVDFVEAGDMKMHTAGSLKNGTIVWALAKINDGFSLANGDDVESYLLFSNPHQFGKTVSIKFTPIRVVCNNTLSFSLNKKTKHELTINHRQVFNAEQVKETMGIASYKLDEYKQLAVFLASKKASEDQVKEYFKTVYPTLSTETDKMSRPAKQALEVLETQPGADKSPGTWWNALNAVTYVTDHKQGRTQDNRLYSAWYGGGANTKLKALHIAKEMAYVA